MQASVEQENVGEELKEEEVNFKLSVRSEFAEKINGSIVNTFGLLSKFRNFYSIRNLERKKGEL